MVRIKVSYENVDELNKVIKLLGECMHTLKLVPEQKGKYKRAYIELIDLKNVRIE